MLWCLTPSNRGSAGAKGIGHPLNLIREPIQLVHNRGVDPEFGLKAFPPNRKKLLARGLVAGFYERPFKLHEWAILCIPPGIQLFLGFGFL